MSAKYDLAVIGQGAAAFAAVIKSSELGARTVMIGHNATPGTFLGGTCVNVGCVPSKRLLISGEMYSVDERFEGVSILARELDFSSVIKSKDELIRRLRREKYEKVLQDRENVTYLGQRWLKALKWRHSPSIEM